MKGIATICFAAIGLLIAGCSGPVQEQDGSATQPNQAQPGSPQYLPTVTPTIRTQPTPRVARTYATPTPFPTLEPEPDWEALIAQYKPKHLADFSAPAILSSIEIRLRSGKEYQGTITALSEEAVSLRGERAALTFERTQLHPTSRIRLFAEDYATYKAKQQAAALKSTYDQKRHSFEKTLAAGQPVPAVIDYLNHNLINPESTVFLKWYAPVEDEKGSQVRVKYATRSSGFGMITERKIFFLNKAGRVYQVAGYKETPQD